MTLWKCSPITLTSGGECACSELHRGCVHSLWTPMVGGQWWLGLCLGGWYSLVMDHQYWAALKCVLHQLAAAACENIDFANFSSWSGIHPIYNTTVVLWNSSVNIRIKVKPTFLQLWMHLQQLWISFVDLKLGIR